MASPKKTLILFFVLHTYIILCALFFQTVEYKPSEGNGEGKINVINVMKNLTSRYNISEIQASEIIQQTLKAASDDQHSYMRASWKEFTRAFWFVTIVFTTVGKLIIPFHLHHHV